MKSSKKKIALQSLKNGKYQTVAEACRKAGLADPAHVRKHIYSHGGFQAWVKKGCPI